jgi:ribosome-associated translation inhibitor RaiA
MNDSKRARRAPFAAKIPRPEKAGAGRTPTDRTPLNVRTTGLSLDEDTRIYARRRLGFKLGKFAPRIERVSVRFADVNGPRGGVDTVCRVKVVLSGLDSVLYETRAGDMRSAVDGASDGVARAVRRALEHRRDAKRRSRPGETVAP